jgi:hypothetical protein
MFKKSMFVLLPLQLGLLSNKAHANCGVYAQSVFAMNDLVSYAAVVNQKTLADIVVYRVEGFENELSTVGDGDHSNPDSCFLEGEASGVVVFSYKDMPECILRQRVVRSFKLQRPAYIPLPPQFEFQDLGIECRVKD